MPAARTVLRTTTLLFLATLAGAPAAVAQAGPATPDQSRAVQAVFAHFDRADSPGCIVGVGRNGSIAYRNAFGMASLEYDVPLTPFTVSEIGSVSKQFTAAAVLLLAQDGKLSLDDPVRRHDPEFPDFGAPVTIRHLLNHTSGLRDQFGLLELAGRPNGGVVTTVGEVVDLALRQRTLNFPPNTEYLYSNTGYTFMNALVERVSGQTFVDFTTERIFRPLGMTNTRWRDDFSRVVRNRAQAYRPDGRGGWAQEMPFSNLHGSGGLITTVEDLILWTEALHGDRVGRPGFAAEMMRSGVLEDGRETGYALGLSVGDYRGVRQVGHGGSTAGYRAHLVHYPDEGLTVAIECNLTTANAASLANSVTEVFLGDRLQPERATPAPVAVAPAELERRAGLYHNPTTHQVIRLAARNGRLEGGGFTLVPAGGDRFVQAGGGGAEYRYVMASNGRSAELRSDGNVLVAKEPWSPSPADLAAFAGTYHNAEIGSTVRLAVEDGRLVMRYPPAAAVSLEPVFTDAFVGGGRTLIFRREGAGAPGGFAYHAGRVRNIAFER